MSSSKSKPVPAFYNSQESAHVLPVLSSQVEMVYQPTSHVHVSACEEMTLTQLDVLSQESADARVKTARARTPRAPTPREKTPTRVPSGSAKQVTIDLPRTDSEHSEGSPAPSESSLSSIASEQEANDKIPKPSGEAGRPGRGGYNLEEQLGWGEEGFKALKRLVNKAIKKHLDTTKCRSLQDRKALDAVCNLANATFPDLDAFQCCWPVLDLIQMRLKYLSSRARQKKRSSGEAEKGRRTRNRSRSRSPVANTSKSVVSLKK